MTRNNNQIEELHSPREFTEYARNHGAEVDEAGFNIFVRTGRGATVYPRRDGELPESLRRHLVEIFLALGLASLLLVVGVAVVHLL